MARGAVPSPRRRSSAEVISRASGLPGDDGEDIGNWSEPLGMTSLFVESAVFLLAVYKSWTLAGFLNAGP